MQIKNKYSQDPSLFKDGMSGLSMHKSTLLWYFWRGGKRKT